MTKRVAKSYCLFLVLTMNAMAQNISTNDLQLWLRADAGITKDGEQVSHWDDQSGQGSYAEQSDPELMPLFVTNAVNSQPAVQFDGVNDYMSFYLPETLNGLTEMTIAIVCANTQNSSTGSSQAERAVIFWNETTSWGTVYVSPYQRTIAWRFGTTQTNNRQIYTRPVSIGSEFSLTITKKQSDTDTLYINGQQADQKTGKKVDIDGQQDEGQLGRGYNNDTYYPGMIAEVMVYLRALTDLERQNVESYLMSKYALAAAVSEWAVYDN